MYKTNMLSQNVERTSVKHSLKVPAPLNFDVICDVVLMMMALILMIITMT